jgi:hypothetical protein
MKSILRVIAILTLLLGVNSIFAQNGSLDINSSIDSDPNDNNSTEEVVQNDVQEAYPSISLLLELKNGSFQTVMYFETNVVSNEMGEPFATIKGDTKALFLSRIEGLGKENDVESFRIDAEKQSIFIGFKTSDHDEALQLIQKTVAD